MRRLFFLLAFAACATPAWALRTGDKAVEPQGAFVVGKPFRLVPYTVNSADKGKLKVLVCFNVWTAASREAMPTLRDLARKYEGKVNFLLIASDGRKDVAQFARDFPYLAMPIAAEAVKSVGLYMGGGMIYPKAFVITSEGVIIWDGEVIDLVEMLEQYYAGGFDEEKSKQLSKLLDQLQTALRSADERTGEKLAQEILRLDPANSAALRLRLFMLESTERVQAAHDLLAKQQKTVPNEKKIYLFQLDMALRHPEYASECTAILRGLFASGAPRAEKMMMLWRALAMQQFDSELLAFAHEQLFVLAEDASKSGKFSPPEERLHLALSALVACRTGRLDRAIELQEKAIGVPGLPPDQNLSAMLDFYRNARKTGQVKY